METSDAGHRSPTIADFASAKQELYNAIGDLVIASQVDLSRSRKRKSAEGIRTVIKAGESLKSKVHSVCLNVSFMVEEDKIRRRKSSGGNDTARLSVTSSAR